MRTTGRPLPRQKHDVNHKQQCTMYSSNFTAPSHGLNTERPSPQLVVGLQLDFTRRQCIIAQLRQAALSIAQGHGPHQFRLSLRSTLPANMHQPLTPAATCELKKLNGEFQLTSFTYLLNSTIGPHAHERPQLTRNEIKWWLTSISLQLLHVLQQIKCK